MPGSWSDYLELRKGSAPPPSTEDGDVRLYADSDGALRSIQSDGTDAAVGGGGGSMPLHGWGVHWSNNSGWSVNGGGFIWGTDGFEPTAIDWDTDGYANPESAPFFDPSTPVGLGGIYLCRFMVVYSCDTAGGFAGQNIGGSGHGNSWSPILGTAVTDRQIATHIELLNLGEEDNSADVAHFVNFGDNAVSVYRAEYWGVRIAPQPA